MTALNNLHGVPLSRVLVLWACVLFAVSIILLGIRLSNLSPIEIVIEGREVNLEHTARSYSQIDVQWTIFLSALAGGALIYLVTHQYATRNPRNPRNTSPSANNQQPSLPPRSSRVENPDASGQEPPPRQDSGLDPFNIDEAKIRMWQGVHSRLKGNEKKVYGCVLDSEGVTPQAEIAKETGLSKGTVSTILGRLEARDLLEKRRAGMINIIILRTGPRPTPKPRTHKENQTQNQGS